MKKVCLICCALVCFLMGCNVNEKLESSREKARQMSCTTNLKLIGTAVRMFVDDKGAFPTVADLQTDAFMQNLGDAKFLKCIKAPDENYRFFLNGKKDTEIKDPSQTIIAICDKHGDQVNVLFADGHVESVAKDIVNKAIENTPNGEMPVLQK